MNDFIKGKSQISIELFDHFWIQFNKIGEVQLHPTKSMIGISNSTKRIAWVTQLGKDFVHIVFPFDPKIRHLIVCIDCRDRPRDTPSTKTRWGIYSSR